MIFAGGEYRAEGDKTPKSYFLERMGLDGKPVWRIDQTDRVSHVMSSGELIFLKLRKGEIKALDRVGFGSLTKKNLPRGQCRFLTAKEVGFLKMLG